MYVYGRDKSAPVLYKGSYNAAYLNPYICNYCDSQGYTHKTSGPTYGYASGASSYGGYNQGHVGYAAPAPVYTSGHGGHVVAAPAHGGYTGGHVVAAAPAHGGYTAVAPAHGGYSSGHGGYSSSHSHGYKAAKPQIVGTYKSSSTKKVTDIKHDKKVAEGTQKGTYVRTTVEPPKVVGY